MISPESVPRPVAAPPSHDDVAAPLKPVAYTYPAQLFLACVFLGPYWVVSLMVVANRWLPPTDATNFKNLLLTMLTSLTVGSGGGAVASSLMRGWGKISSQLKGGSSK